MRRELPDRAALAFAPIHKRAFGIAVGSAASVACFALTAIYLLRAPRPGFDLALLGQYFYGYTVSWRGALIAAGWGFLVGFVAGWFVAFVRNLVLALAVFSTRTRADLRETRDFLDHI